MLEGKRIIAIIPARGGSKVVPRKNLRCVNGKTLLALTIETARLSKMIDRIIVSSEDPEIIAEARRAGAEVPFVRPLALAQDETPGHEPILHALTQLPGYDYVVVLQVTSPLRNVTDIDGCLHFCLQENAPACVSVCETDISPYWTFRIKNNFKLRPVLTEKIPLRRQDLPITYVLNGSIYVADINWFMAKKSFLSAETIGYVMPKERSLDIDTEFDFFLLETYLKINMSTRSQVKKWKESKKELL